MKEGEVAPKTKAGKRRVPIIPELRELLVAEKLRTGGRGYVFGGEHAPVSPFPIYKSGRPAWKSIGVKPVCLHECRHTYASFLIAAGVNAKPLSTYMGHSSIQVTYDLYGHLMPGNEDEAGQLLTAYLEKSWAASA
jgi:integrase